MIMACLNNSTCLSSRRRPGSIHLIQQDIADRNKLANSAEIHRLLGSNTSDKEKNKRVITHCCWCDRSEGIRWGRTEAFLHYRVL